MLAVVDDSTRENLALVVDTSLSGARVARELDAIIAARGRPLMIVSDNGTELTSLAILRWAQDRQIEWHYIAPGKPQQNGRHERMHLTLKREATKPVAANTLQQQARFDAFVPATTRSGRTRRSADCIRPRSIHLQRGLTRRLRIPSTRSTIAPCASRAAGASASRAPA